MNSEDLRKRGKRTLTWALTIMLLLSVLGATYVSLNPPGATDPYTEFYLLGPDGETASDYPENLTVGEPGEFTVGITNHEHQRQTYTIGVVVNGEVQTERTVTVADEDTWQDQFTYTGESSGEKRIRVLLYKGDSVNLEEEPYRFGQLLVTVEETTDPGNSSPNERINETEYLS